MTKTTIFNTNRLKIMIFMITVFTASTGYSQEKWSVTLAGGAASGDGPIDGGYFVSFDVGIPVANWLSIAPTVNFVSTIPSNKIENSWNKDFPGASYFSEDDLEKQSYGGDILGSVNLILLFKPFSLLNNPAFKKHELALGAGYGLKSYTGVSAYFENIDQEPELIRFRHESNISVEPIFGKLFYNYHFSEKFFAGITATLDGFDGEAAALFGFQIGMNFSTQKTE